MLASLVFSVTMRCNVECDLCGLHCSPRRTERLTLPFMKRIMDEYAAFRVGAHVTFTGGEPLTIGRDLLEAVRHASGLGFTTRIVTNGAWARSPRVALGLVARFRDAGLTEMNVSVDDFHQAHISIERVKNAHDACAEAGVRILLAHKALTSSTVTVKSLERLFGRTLVNFDVARRAVPKREPPTAFLVSTAGCVPAGPNHDAHSEAEYNYGYHPFAHRQRCASVLKDVVVSSTCALEACCGVVGNDIPELSFGNLEVDSLLDLLSQADDDLIVNWLALEGPWGIAEYVRSVAPEVRFEKRYVNACHLCRDVLMDLRSRAILATISPDKVAEIRYRRWVYDRLRQDGMAAHRMFEVPASGGGEELGSRCAR